MGTVLQLDRNLTWRLVESSFALNRRGADIPWDDLEANRVKKWEGSKSFTLLPVNNLRSFSETNKYEGVKFRLADCFYDPAYWVEHPENILPTDSAGPGYCDWFFNCQVPASKVPTSSDAATTRNQLLQLMFRAAETAALQAIANQYDRATSSVCALASKEVFGANQGYCLRFSFDTRKQSERSRPLDFVFGDFWLAINLDGTCDLYQTTDFVTWRHWETFAWSDGQTPDRGRILIYPHARNLIEFEFRSAKSKLRKRSKGGDDYVYRLANPTSSHVFVSRADTYVPESAGYEITKPGQWFLFTSLESRAFIQVSRIGFLNGSGKAATVIDNPIVLPEPPLAPFSTSVRADVPAGTQIRHDLYAPQFPIVKVGDPFESDGKQAAFQFVAYLQGKGDVPTKKGIAPLSTVSPEIYGYLAWKGAILEAPPSGTPVETKVRSAKIDAGDSPESATYEFLVDNSNGALDAFEERANIDFRLYDDVTNLTLAEGTIYEVEATDAPANEPRSLAFRGRGEADALLQTYSIDLDFTEDPSAPGFAWRWQQAALACFEEAGFGQDQVVFEDVEGIDGSRYNFRLWNEADSSTSGGAKGASSAGQRWRPNPNVPLHEFLDHLIRRILGWHWVKSPRDSKWHIYKRPRPGYWDDTKVRAAFFKNRAALAADVAANPFAEYGRYLHASKRPWAKRPACTTIKAFAQFPTRILKTRAELEAVLRTPQTEESAASSLYDDVARLMCLTLDNPRGYRHSGKPEPDPTHPDYMRKRIVRRIPLPLAGSREAFVWMARRFYEDLCFGYSGCTFNADWGDERTFDLRKWDLVLVDGRKAWVNDIEASWAHDTMRRARYSITWWRADASPPR